MKELAIALWSMTAAHHQWPMRPTVPVAVVQRSPEAARELTAMEKQELKEALLRGTKCATGKSFFDRASGLYLPEIREGCNWEVVGGATAGAVRER